MTLRHLSAALAALALAAAAFATDEKAKPAADPAKKDAKKPAAEAKPSDAKPAAAATAAPAAEAKPAVDAVDETNKTVYALGLFLSQNLKPLALTEDDLSWLQAGLADGILGRPPKVEISVYGPKIQALAESRAAAASVEEKKAGAAFLAKLGKEPGAKGFGNAGGLMFELKAGTGASPKATDKVKVHYHGTLIDGTVFDSSVQRGEPASFPLNGVIPCWTESVQLMKVGGKYKVACPSDSAYGDRGSPPAIKPGATLVFEIELLGIEN